MIQDMPRQYKRGRRHSLMLAFYDLLILILCDLLMLVVYPSEITPLSTPAVIHQSVMSIAGIMSCRVLLGIYKQIWRYGGTSQYIRLFVADALGGAVYLVLMFLLPVERIAALRALALVGINLLAATAVRLLYQYMYEYSTQDSKLTTLLRRVTYLLTGVKIQPVNTNGRPASHRINIAIVGAGRVGVMLADELLRNPSAAYQPCCFVDIDHEKIGRYISGLRVFAEEEFTPQTIAAFPIQEIVFAMPEVDVACKQKLYARYKTTGCKIKVYDYPNPQKPGSKRTLHDFDVTELLFRQTVDFTDEQTVGYYAGKTVLISGGGGSIGSELCRQIAKMHPKRLVLLDVYENGAYDIQQELLTQYGSQLDMAVEIASVCDRRALEHVFAKHHPQVVLHAAAHKHVPLMEHNCVEAVKNNVFGTLNMVEVSEAFGVEKFTMISTDKAVNPTNVMGATKRVCEMIVQSRTGSRTNFSATRFGNVLGSNGSVIPLFRRQIMNGGPVTLTDKQIIRYFMTIPEATQLVLQSGAMAKNGELYVLDMGKPVKILDLAENMIRLSGYEPYRDIDIVEIGLRPGEKLYEELLIRTEELDKTSNSLIFVERDKPLSLEEISRKLDVLRTAVNTDDDEAVRAALHQVVPTFEPPEKVNAAAIHAVEMQAAQQSAPV